MTYALHEIDHRFTISGHVRDNQGAAQSGESVVVKDTAGGILGKATSGPSGFYSIRLHLHNEDIGRKFEVSTKTQTQPLQIKFDPDNVKDERTVEVNFGSPGIATPLWESPTFLTFAALITFGGGIYLFMAQQRKRLRRAKHGGTPRKRR
tara:strand:- start:1756 stop:2205 length:450 start_codon:yes stop_codon:yes gene_type:complete